MNVPPEDIPELAQVAYAEFCRLLDPLLRNHPPVTFANEAEEREWQTIVLAVLRVLDEDTP